VWADGKRRCGWVGDDPLYLDYHDREWGVPLHGEQALFELLTLEGAQAGLSWLTVLRKRDNYRAAFAQFDAEAVARFSARDVTRLMNDPGIVRNRLKIESTISNARATLALRDSDGGLDAFVWSFVGGTPQLNRWRTLKQVPAQTAVAQRLSKALQQRGFRFVGPTIIYAFMQAAGLVNDHLRDCFRHSAA
jgi:DNA-3-methyladenine glycosylase I